LNKKKLWIIGSLVAFFGFVIVVGVVVFLYPFFTFIFRSGPETPSELREARVVLGAERFQKDILIASERRNQKSRDIGSIEDIAVGKLDGKDGTDIVVAGRYGAGLFDEQGNQQSQVFFENPTSTIGKILDTDRLRSIGDMRIVDLENDGQCEYFGRGGLDGAAVFDHLGKQLWVYGGHTSGKSYIKDMSAGDMDGDGTKEFATLYNGVELLDKAGKVLWSDPAAEYSSHIEIGDTEGDGKSEIIYSRHGDCFISNTKSEFQKKLDLPYFFSQFEICKLPDQKALGILIVEEGFLCILDFDGKMRYQWEIPLSRFVSETRKDRFGGKEETSVYTTKSVWGKFFQGQTECLALVTRFAGLDSSVLYIYNKAGELLYQEVLPEESQAIALMPRAGNNEISDLLIAGSKTVWRYAGK
jgi:hypothetical protein